MRLRELLVAIKIKVDTKAAEKVDKVLGQITKHAKEATRAIDGTAKAADKLDRNLDKTAKSGKQASRGMDSFTRSAKKAEQAADQAGKAADRAGDKISAAGKKASRGGGFGKALAGADWKGAAGNIATRGAAVLAAGAVAGGFALEAGMERESLRQTLKNIEQDEQKATETYQRIVKLAAATPFQIEEITSGVIKLKSQGLNANNEAVTAYGDLASTMGKNLDDMVEATKDAVTGEFERLKEFGIKASKSGDIVSFTFKGVTTEIQNNASAIEDYLIGLGQMPGVAGAMAGQMDTLRGKFSNFKDSFVSALDEALTSSGAMDEAKGLLEDLTGTAEDGASVFGELLAGALKDLRTWVRGLTREQIREWMERAARAGREFLEMGLSLMDMLLKLVTAVAEAADSFEGGERAIQTLTIALGALMLAGGGLPGLFAAIGAAAVKMGMDAAEADLEYKSLFGNIKQFQNMFNIKTLMGQDGPMSGVDDGTGVRHSNELSQGNEDWLTKATEANRQGLGEEFFVGAEGQLVQLGIEEAVDPGDLDGRVKRMQARGNRTAEQVLAQQSGGARVGVNKEAAKFLDALEEKRGKDIDKFARQARERGLDSEAVETVVAAREAELDARAKKAAQSFTSSLRKEGDIDKALGAGLKELDDKEKKKKGGKGKKKKAEDGGKDILQALGLKGPGSILENRPAPQSLMIQTTIVTKAAESIAVHVEVPEGASFDMAKETIGNEVGKAIDAAARKQLMVIFDDAWTLRWNELGKARGGGRVPKSSKKRGAPL